MRRGDQLGIQVRTNYSLISTVLVSDAYQGKKELCIFITRLKVLLVNNLFTSSKLQHVLECTMISCMIIRLPYFNSLLPFQACLQNKLTKFASHVSEGGRCLCRYPSNGIFIDKHRGIKCIIMEEWVKTTCSGTHFQSNVFSASHYFYFKLIFFNLVVIFSVDL